MRVNVLIGPHFRARSLDRTRICRRSFSVVTSTQSARKAEQNSHLKSLATTTSGEEHATRVHPSTWICLAAGVIGIGAWSIHQSTPTFNDATSLYIKVTESLVGGVDSISWKGTVFPALGLAAANAKLKAFEDRPVDLLPANGTDVTRFDSVQLPSNSPVEDTKSYGEVNIGETADWKFWGVYDGHAGWATSRVLQGALPAYVARSLRQIRNSNEPCSPEAIDQAIKTGFLNLDNEIMSDGLLALSDAKTRAEAISRFAPAKAGSCALLAIFNPTTSTLRVACTGDSRAVLGRRHPSAPNTTYTAEPLSTDQTGFNPTEVSRIAAAHPDHPDAIDPKTGRILGLAVTRAFGDHRFKWPLDAIKQAETTIYGTPPRPKYISPPYVTAEPEVTTTTVASGDFLILATDGLWDHISSEHAVECVRLWIEQQRQTHKVEKDSPTSAIAKSRLVVEKEEKKEPDQVFDADYKVTPGDFVVDHDDDNAATHLVRNALGGRKTEVFCAVMSTQPPDSRNVRDDITVQVVFFGDVFGSKGEKG